MEIDSSVAQSRLTFGGLATGLDTGAIVEALLEAERLPLRRLEARKSELEERQSLVRDLNTKLLALRDAARAVDNRTDTLTGFSLDEEFLDYEATSSDESLLQVTASSNAVPGTYEVRVESLASVGRRVSKVYAAPDDFVDNKNRDFSIDYGGETTIDVAIQKNETTLQQLADAINASEENDGSVRAQVLFDGSGYRLVVSGTQTGAENDVVVTTNVKDFVDDALTQVASDASFTAFGVPITRPSNEISDVIPGVSMTLTGVNDPGNPSSVTAIVVSRSDLEVVERLQALVDAYNAIRQVSIEQSQVDDVTGRAGPLSGDATLRGVERTVQGVLGGIYEFTDNPFSSLGEIGISFDRDGRISLDQARLTEALDEDAQAVRQLLSGTDEADGVAAALARTLEPIVRSGDGTMAIRDESFDDRIRNVEDQIARFEDRLAIREEVLIRRFTELERLVNTLQSQSGFRTGFGQQQTGV